MANTKKRVLSLLLAAVMMLTMMPMNAIALEIPGLGDLGALAEIAELIGKGKLVCEDENHCEHGDDCYVTEQKMQTEHNENCYHKHVTSCYALGANCSYKTVWGIKIPTCGHGSVHCGMTKETLICNNQHGMIDVTTLVCEKEEHNDDCYVNYEDVKAAFDHIESAQELGKTALEFGKCWLGGGKCGITYKLGEIELNLCEEHFCDLCSRLHSYCECVEITFANIGNVAENTEIVKVKAGEKVDAAKVPNAELFNYHFLGWFDENGNEFDAETVYTEDITFTAQYKALTETEKLENTINFIKNNFNLGAELGRMLTILSKGEITKETIVSNKDKVISAIDMYLLTNQLTGKITPEQAQEIIDLMKESDEYTTLFAEWLWPENAVLMPEVDEILANIDFEKLAEEIKAAIAEKYGIEFTQEWIDENRALAEQYIAEALKEAEAVTEAQKQLLLEQLEAKKAEAMLVMAMIRCEMVRNIKNKIENVKEFVKSLLADTALGIKMGKNISRLSGLTNDSAMKHGAEFKKALIAALSLTNLTETQQNAVAELIDENDGIVVEFIDWLWPQVTVYWMNGGKLLEKDVIPFDEEPVYDGATPVKEGDVQHSFVFTGWEKTEEDGDIVYTAVFATEINEYTITFVNEDGTVLSTESVPYGTTPEYNGETPVKEGNAQYSYTFAGWDKAIATVTGDATYTATFEKSVNNYTVTFVVDGVESKVTYAYGTTPAHADPTKAADAEYTYKFTGWDKEFAPVTGDVIYTAQFEAIPVLYTVTWMVNGEAVETDSVRYNTMPEYNGETPAIDGGAQYTYTFTGWDKEFAPVTESVIYTALFNTAVNEYTVTFVDEDGTVLETKTVAYGETPVYTGATPFKADTAEFYYDFAGFGEIAAVTGDVTYTAQYTATRCTYRVTFKDGDKTLSSLIYAYGDTIVAPELPTKKGWDSAWNCEFSTVTGELTVEVVWTYKVFGSHDLKVFVGYGKSAADSTKGWFQTNNGTIYNARDYYSYYVDGKYTGSTVMTQGVDYDSYTAAPGNITVDGIVYSNETGSDFYVIHEYVVVATAAEYHLDCHATLYHTVTFVDYNGNVIDTVTVEHGTDVVAPADPTRMGYVFTGWSEDLSSVEKSMTVTAEYDYEYLASSKLKINVGNGTPASGSTKGNALSHWGKIYDARSYYSYYDYPNYRGDSIMSEDEFDFARTHAEAIPGNVKYDGVVYTNGEGTSDNYYVLTGEYAYVACRGEYHLDLKASFYNVYTFVVDGVETKVTALQGTDPVAPADPSKDGYEFDGWEIDENGVYNAKFTKIHRVTFYLPTGGNTKVYVRDGELLEEFIPESAAGERFLYWYNSKGGAKLDYSKPITGNMAFSAKCKWIIEDHDVTLMGVLNGKNYNLGMAVFEDSYHARKYSNKWLTADQYDPAKIILPDTLSDITVDGVTYTYGSGDNYYTVEFNALDSHMEKGYSYRYYGDVELFHSKVVVNVKIIDGGSRQIKLYDVAHGTVIDTQWLIDNVNPYLVIEEEVVINEAGEYTVRAIYTGN